MTTHASARTTISLKSRCRMTLPRGTQFVSYRVFSADGHPVGGSLVFSIGMSKGTVAARAEGTTGLAP